MIDKMKSMFQELDGSRFVSVEKWPHQALVVPRLQAHRGYWIEGIQENTLEAFQQARLRGALMFECDVRLTKDHVPVVFHDEDLSRLGGRPDKVSDVTAAEMKRIANAPTLREVLSDPQVPRLANLELKTKIKVDDALERRVSEVVRQTRAENRVMFSSFNPMSLFRIGLHLPHVPRALLATREDDPDNSRWLSQMWLAPFFSFHLLHLDHRMVTPETMNFWRRRRIPISVWTVNGKEEIQKYLKMGVMSVITDTL